MTEKRSRGEVRNSKLQKVAAEPSHSYLLPRVKAYSVSPAATMMCCWLSRVQVDGPLLRRVLRGSDQRIEPSVGLKAARRLESPVKRRLPAVVRIPPEMPPPSERSPLEMCFHLMFPVVTSRAMREDLGSKVPEPPPP